jgi:hypothetical protein
LKDVASKVVGLVETMPEEKYDSPPKAYDSYSQFCENQTSLPDLAPLLRFDG